MLTTLLALTSLCAVAGSPAATLRAAPHTLQLSTSKPAHVWPEQGSQTWSVALSSDGSAAWAWADVTTPAAVYRPPGTPGYEAMDYDSDGRLLVWRRESVAIRYDLRAGTAQVCDAKRLHRVDAAGHTSQDADRHHDWSQLPAEAEPLWGLVWAALGDASLEQHARVRNQRPSAEHAPLAAHGEIPLGPDAVMTADLVSFTASFTPEVRDEAERRIAACAGLPLDVD
jgi:hypothetical protein